MMYYYNDADKIKIAGIVENSIVDGPGLRYVIFTQGCFHNCKGCHNPQTHSIDGGRYEEVNKLAKDINSDPLLKGITLSGGEPFLQAKALSNLILKIDRRLSVITYTGFKFEELMDKKDSTNCFFDLIKNSDIIIDGKFEEDKKDEELLFRGSSNQRVIDVKKTLECGKIIEYDFN